MKHRKLLLVTVVALLLMFVIAHSEILKAKNKVYVTPRNNPVKIVTPTPQITYHGLPMRLLIPSIGVDTSIESMGLTKSGGMDAPSKATTAGWYKYGAIPGDKGSAVLDGHIVGLRGEAGVFFNLHKLQVGDSLSVIDGKGQTTTFKVRGVRAYNQNEEHDEVFNSQDKAHLNIITCAGEWDAGQQHYLARLVVFADISN